MPVSDTQINERLVYPWRPDDGISPSDKMRRTLARSAAKTQQALRSWSFVDWISFFIPCVAWLRTYQWSNWLGVGARSSTLPLTTLLPQLRDPS